MTLARMPITAHEQQALKRIFNTGWVVSWELMPGTPEWRYAVAGEGYHKERPGTLTAQLRILDGQERSELHLELDGRQWEGEPGEVVARFVSDMAAWE